MGNGVLGRLKPGKVEATVWALVDGILARAKTRDFLYLLVVILLPFHSVPGTNPHLIHPSVLGTGTVIRVTAMEDNVINFRCRLVKPFPSALNQVINHTR